MTTMPKLPVDVLCNGLTSDEAKLIRAAFNGKTGCLRASKPFKDSDCMAGKPDAEFKGRANYVWRFLCFDYCNSHPHSCIPVTADFGISYSDPVREGRMDRTRAVTKELDALVKRAESNLPVTAQAGTMRWGRALGLI